MQCPQRVQLLNTMQNQLIKCLPKLWQTMHMAQNSLPKLMPLMHNHDQNQWEFKQKDHPQTWAKTKLKHLSGTCLTRHGNKSDKTILCQNTGNRKLITKLTLCGIDAYTHYLPPAENTAHANPECNGNPNLDHINNAHKTPGRILPEFQQQNGYKPNNQLTACKLKTMSNKGASNCTQYTCIRLCKTMSHTWTMAIGNNWQI